jgi:osmotically-inducible protein OsmY
VTTPQSYLAKKAAKTAARATLRHAAHGTATKAKRQPIRSVTLLTVGALLGALVATVLARRRAANVEAHRIAEEARIAAERADQERASARHEERRRQADDRTLTDRVKSEIFRPADAPKGDVVVDSENGVVHLRGSVANTALRDRLVTSARGVDGVARVEDLLKVRD